MSMYRTLRLLALSLLYEFPPTRSWAYARLPRHRSGYQKHWTGELGKTQRATLKKRQDATLQRFFPTPRGLRRRIAVYNPGTVLDIGCGYGRFLEEMTQHFNVEGCDIAQDLLEQVRPDLQTKVFQLDIVRPPLGWVSSPSNRWDIAYAWAVFMYFIDDSESMRLAMKHADEITKKRVVVWDWKHVCNKMKAVYPSDKFEYHHIPLIMG